MCFGRLLVCSPAGGKDGVISGGDQDRKSMIDGRYLTPFGRVFCQCSSLVIVLALLGPGCCGQKQAGKEDDTYEIQPSDDDKTSQSCESTVTQGDQELEGS